VIAGQGAEQQQLARAPADIRSRRIQAELVAILFSRARVTIFTSLATGSIAFLLVCRHVPLSWGLGWLAYLVLVSVARLRLVRSFERAAPPPDDILRWANYFTAGTSATAAFWGAGAIMVFGFLPSNMLLAVFFVMVFAGYAAGSASTQALYLPNCYAFLVILLGSLVVGFLMLGDTLHLALAGVTLIYLAFNVSMARSHHRTHAESIALRFANIELIEELERKSAEAEAANVAKSKFLAAASHDLRQPLHALILFVSALNEHIRYPEVRRIVDHIHRSVHALEQLFNALLDISRLDAGTIRPEPRDFPLRELMVRLRNDYEHEATSKGLSFRCTDSPFFVRSEPQWLERILRNYLSNAIRYTERGAVTVSAVLSGPSVRIEVADTGKGIPHSAQQEIFREFYQLDNPERDRNKGLGLGLAIVDRLARLLDHPIDVQSEPGRGSVFSVTVPLGSETAAGTSRYVAAGGTDLAAMTVLVIDDEASVREGMEALLSQWNCEVLLASNESDAVARVRDRGETPDAIIADYRLADGRTGIQAIGALERECGRPVPAVIVTGDIAPDRLREVAASGLPLLHKPVAPARLRAFLQQARAALNTVAT
jgi:two-component system, sensor histidine kinase